jgi:hypothetical protein
MGRIIRDGDAQGKACPPALSPLGIRGAGRGSAPL